MFEFLKRSKDPPVEDRSYTEYRAGYTDALVTLAAQRAAGGSTTGNPSDTAAVEFGVGLLERCFATALVEPPLPALNPAMLGFAARSLALHGNYVAGIGVDLDGVLRLEPAATWDIAGGSNPAGWRYELELTGPTRGQRRRLPASAVIHVRIGADANTPWMGVSPLVSAGISAQTLANAERSMRAETKSRVGYLLPIPEGLTDAALAALRADLGALDGNTALVETSRGGAGQGPSHAPGQDWTPKRFGADIPQYTVQLRRDVGADVVAALGIPKGLFEGRDLRESYRQLLTATVQPLAQIIGAELSEKLERPVTFNFRRLAAADVAARARAYNSLIQAKMDPAEALPLAGLAE